MTRVESISKKITDSEASAAQLKACPETPLNEGNPDSSAPLLGCHSERSSAASSLTGYAKNLRRCGAIFSRSPQDSITVLPLCGPSDPLPRRHGMPLEPPHQRSPAHVSRLAANPSRAEMNIEASPEAAEGTASISTVGMECRISSRDARLR